MMRGMIIGEKVLKERKTNILTVENQERIVDTCQKYEEIPDYFYIADFEEIEKNDYDLDIKKYVRIQNKIEEINQKEIAKRVDLLEKERDKVQSQIENLIEKMKIT